MNARTKLMTFGAYPKALELFDFVVADMASLWDRACRINALEGGAACPQDAGLVAATSKRVEGNALHLWVIAGIEEKEGSTAWTRLSQELSADFITACIALRWKFSGKLLPLSPALVPI